jgi:hypothetical protein
MAKTLKRRLRRRHLAAPSREKRIEPGPIFESPKPKTEPISLLINKQAVKSIKK